MKSNSYYSYETIMKKLLKYLISYRSKIILKKALYFLLDISDFIFRKSRKLLPPRRLNFVGSPDFENVGKEFYGHFEKLGGLQTTDAVLDIGCGVGRMALPFTDYIRPPGSYLGFDIVKKGIAWCQQNITTRYPHFRFIHADIENKFYNPRGKVLSQEYRFPAGGGTFDFSFATSVFTHMLPEEVTHYIKEASRVTKKGGKVFFTFFLIPQGYSTHFETDAITFQYIYHNIAFYSHKDCVEAEVGYPEEWVRKIMEDSNFSILKIYPGKWKDPDGISYQDIVVAHKGPNS